MSRRRLTLPPGSAHAARIALAASLLIGVVYAGCVIVLDRVVSARLVAAVDERLQERLADVRETGAPAVGVGADDDDDDFDAPPLYLWLVRPGGSVTPLSTGAPRLQASGSLAGHPALTVPLAPGLFRLDTMRYGRSLLVAGQSLAEQYHVEAVLGVGEALAAPVLLLAVFIGSLIIGLRALSPVEHSRRRQLEFTADASHELRTPLSVISAEAGIALGGQRKAADYRAALARIQGEGERLRRIVEDLLWLARFDSQPPQPGNEPLDLATIAAGCADRFRALARSHAIDIVLASEGAEPAWISAPPEWIDRLAGVLVDNACRYAGPDGTVRIGVSQRASRVTLTVEDSGPGIPAKDRDRLFDRFHRATEQGGGAGLGLAIADSIVRSTGGQWRIGDSPLGGALFAVSWRRAAMRQHSLAPRFGAADATGRPAR
ncbi:MAG TPA: HAMP domain-containing sensor histidine kinase [Streptosporangiaceae bacterium]|nr:HAMP domain-containing sensor histidine kinase [Streptosporangiaceae bacterium]